MLGKQSVMYKIMHNKMFIIFYILRLTATLRVLLSVMGLTGVPTTCMLYETYVGITECDASTTIPYALWQIKLGEIAQNH